MPYRTKFIDPDNRREPKTEHFCARCHKDLKPGQLFRVMHLVDGGPWAIHPEDEAAYDKPAADMGDWPVGMDCAKRIGLEFTRDNAGWLS